MKAKYYIPFFWKGSEGFGQASVTIAIDFIPFTVDGMEKLESLISKQNNFDGVVIINIIPLQE